tara:strand:+ start:203 stop:445 length:243 start_codon:yes stop_codon:yes gene_type:complete
MLRKVLGLVFSALIILLLFGLIVSENVRSNLFILAETLSSGGLAGIIIIIYLIWAAWDALKTLKSLFKARGLNSKFWNDV